MNVMFRQGIVRTQTPLLVKNGSSIQLQTTNTPFVVTCSHGINEYMFTEPTQQGTIVAWTNLPTSRSYWLYVDFDKITGARSFGYTTEDWLIGRSTEPTASEGKMWFDTTVRVIRKCVRILNTDGSPVVNSVGQQVYQWNLETPLDNQHCFDPTQNKMLVYADGRWVDKIRVFVAFVLNGVTIQEQGIGSQVGLVGDYYSGRVLFDGKGSAIRKRDGSFLTTEDQWFVDGSNIQSSRLEADIHQALAEEPIPKFSVVKYGDFERVRLAKYEDIGFAVLAIATNSGTHNQTINLVVQGTVTNSDWNWPTVNAELWVDEAGELTDINPSIGNSIRGQRVPVARVIGRTTIFFEQGLGGVGSGTATVAPVEVQKATNTIYGVSRLSVPSNSIDDPIVVSTNDPRLSDARPPLSHTHQAVQVSTTIYDTLTGSNVQTNLEELQNQKLGKQGGTLSGYLTLYTHPSQPLHAATKQYVDNAVHGLMSTQSADLAYVNVIGDIMTGYLTLYANPTQPLHAATKQYVDNGLLSKADIIYVDNGLALKSDNTHIHSLDALSNVVTLGKVNGDTIIWNESLQMWTEGSGTVDTSGLVQKAGDVMTGFLTLNSSPTDNLHAATKSYVDDSQIIATFQVGLIPVGGREQTIPGDYHAHYVHLFKPDADQLILNIVPSVTLTTVEVNGHTHDVTIGYNATDATFIVLSIGGNETDLHEARVVDYGGVDATQFVSKSGDVMVGSLTLAADPIELLEAATKQYVDVTQIITTFQIGKIVGAGHIHYAHLFKQEAEALILNNVSSVTLTTEEVNGHTHVITVRYDAERATFTVLTIETNDVDQHEAFVVDYGGVDTTQFISKAGDVMVGSLTLAADPVELLEAATKQYVDNSVITNLPYDFAFFVSGEIDTTEIIIGSIIITRLITINSQFSESLAYSHDIPSENTTLRILKNGTEIGHIEFNTSSNYGTFVGPVYDPYDPYSTPVVDHTLQIGDRLDIVSSTEVPITVKLLNTVITIVGCAQVVSCPVPTTP